MPVLKPVGSDSVACGSGRKRWLFAADMNQARPQLFVSQSRELPRQRGDRADRRQALLRIVAVLANMRIDQRL